jgi:hypothetical protein
MSFVFIALLALFTPQSATGTLGYTAPADWHARPPASSMRVAEFVIPRANGDREDGELIIYYFGAGGGSAEANIQRWIGQMQQPGGRPADARRETRVIHGLKVSMVDVSGTYVAEMSPGASEHFDKPDYRLRAAVVETPHGSYYIKMTGPAKTMAAASPMYDKFVASLRFQQ